MRISDWRSEVCSSDRVGQMQFHQRDAGSQEIQRLDEIRTAGKGDGRESLATQDAHQILAHPAVVVHDIDWASWVHSHSPKPPIPRKRAKPPMVSPPILFFRVSSSSPGGFRRSPQDRTTLLKGKGWIG